MGGKRSVAPTLIVIASGGHQPTAVIQGDIYNVTSCPWNVRCRCAR